MERRRARLGQVLGMAEVRFGHSTGFSLVRMAYSWSRTSGVPISTPDVVAGNANDLAGLAAYADRMVADG